VADDTNEIPQEVYVTILPYEGYSPNTDRAISALEQVRPENLTLANCPRCNEATAIHKANPFFSCRSCDNSDIDVGVKGVL
jgi:hypothetical protein